MTRTDKRSSFLWWEPSDSYEVPGSPPEKESEWKIEGSPVVNLTPVKETPVIAIGSPEWGSLRELRSDKRSSLLWL